MKRPAGDKPSLRPSGGIPRRRAAVSSQSLVETGLLTPGEPLPLVARPSVAGVDLVAWVQSRRDWIRDELASRGGLLCRGFDVTSEAQLEAVVAAVGGELLHYTYRSTPRSEVSGRIYTSTEYPREQEIPLHNEMAYSRSWPMKIGFLCLVAAASGGETPIADSRRVYESIDPAVREELAARGVMYIRNYGEGVDLPWQNVFQTDDRAEVEAFCRRAGIELEWKDGDRLRTRQVCPAVARHPVTGEAVWFNQAHLFHVSSLEPEVRASLLAEFAAEELPRHACFGDGAPIPDEMLEAVRRALRSVEVVFPWQVGDVLLLDNMLTAHGRRPFAGPRRVVVGMAEPHGVEG